MDCSLDELPEVIKSDYIVAVGDALRQYCQVSAAMVFSGLSQVGAEAGRSERTSRSQFTSQVESI